MLQKKFRKSSWHTLIILKPVPTHWYIFCTLGTYCMSNTCGMYNSEQEHIYKIPDIRDLRVHKMALLSIRLCVSRYVHLKTTHLCHHFVRKRCVSCMFTFFPPMPGKCYCLRPTFNTFSFTYKMY